MLERELNLTFGFTSFAFDLGAASDLNEKWVSEVTSGHGSRFEFFLSCVQRRDEGGSRKKTEGGFECLGDFHKTILLVF